MIIMTDSMNFGPEWLRNLSSEGSSTGGSTGGAKYQLADHRYGREEMLALFEKGLPAPSSLASFSTLYSEQQLTPLALLPQSEEERSWQSRPIPPGTLGRGRGNSLERGRISRGRGGYQSYTRPGYDGSGGWGNGEHTEWSPRKEYSRTSSVDNWRRNRGGDEEDGWRSRSGNLEKWGRSASWRDSGENADDRGGASDRMNRGSWHDGPRGPPHRRQWGDSEDHLPEWATENPSESGGSFDASGAFHGSDDEQREQNSSSRGFKKEPHLQKSASVNNMSDKLHHSNSQPLKSSVLKQATDELPEKDKEEENKQQEKDKPVEKEPVKEIVNAPNKTDKSALEPENDPPKTDKSKIDVKETNAPVTAHKADDNLRSSNRVDEDFDRLQEDLVQKLVVEEDLPNKQNLENFGQGSGHNVTHPPPNLVPPVQNSWYYQDPQGDLQGPFSSTEMAEWHKAGYFSNALLVKRQCDESFYRLGDLVSLCGGNPFLSPKPIPPLKSDVSANVTKQFELLQRQLALNQATAMRTALGQNEFWTNLNVLQQREILAQHMIPQPQMAPDLRYLQAASNPLMQMFSQMQQTNKLPGQPVTDKPTPPIAPQLDPIQSLIQQMGGVLPTIPNPIQTAGATRVGGLPPNNGLPPNLHAPPAGLSFPNIPLAAAAAAAAAAASSMPSVGVGMQGIPPTATPTLSTAGTANNVPHNLPPRPNPLGAVDPLSSSGAPMENDPIKSLLRQLQNNKPQQPTAQTAPMDTLWQSNQQFGAIPPKANAQSQWLPQPSNEATPTSVWDVEAPTVVPMSMPQVNTSSSAVHDVAPSASFVDAEREKELTDKRKRQKEEENLRKAKEEKEKARELEEQKKKRELEEKKRKEEQKKQEAEKKAAEEKRKKEEEKIKKELEKAKKEAEEKRLRELDEKRRLKEQRKAEEEARKRSEEQRYQDEERARQEAKEKEEYLRKQQEDKARHENSIRVSRAAPWCQTSPVSITGTSLAEIQRLEKEKKQEQLLQMQKQQQLLQEQQQLSCEKVPVSAMPLGWANRPPVTKKIKSLDEIQMEEQERLVKQATEARLAQIKEKEANPTTFVNATAWKGISWAIAASQWNTGGFWEETSTPKSSTQTKPSSTTTKNSVANNQSKQASSKLSKSKAKKEEQQVMKLFNNSANSSNTGGNNKQDEFMEWCIKTLCKIEASIDIETFVEFLRNVESALEVRDYCKEYLGDSPSTAHFATQFLEKRRLTKPKNTTQKDDMSSPAPAITPSSHLTEFQEVKGKGKKTKKSKMTKLDKSILGFSVTAAPDRINVGDRDYVDH